jgi:phosphoribosylformimino-5-aminoimidazole carboxamide ribotide isomerase
MLQRRPILIPAVDLLDGRVVRLRQGSYDDVTDYGLDPLQAAESFAQQGATLLHVVDLSAARDGRRPAAHDRALRLLVDRSGLAVQVGGGIRTEADVRSALDLGVARVLVGTLAVEHPELAGRLAAETARVAVAVDVRDGTVRAAGWARDSGWSAEAFVRRVAACGTHDMLVTAIERDGTGGGADLELLRRLRPLVPGLLLAAGGIGSAGDVVAAAAAGADGVIIGRALYDGTVRFSDASASLRSSPSESPS